MTWCYGYQPWMDYHVPGAWRLVMAREPLDRLVSLYYFQQGYTRARESTHVSSQQRFNADPSYEDPHSTKERRRHLHFFKRYEAVSSSVWTGAQWRWLREGTPNRSLDEVIHMLLNGAFLVGLTGMFDETLMLWRHFMGLFVEDMLYLKYKHDFSHPSFEQWHPADQVMARELIQLSGDEKYYATVQQVFEHQVKFYGGWDKLNNDTRAFQAVHNQLSRQCHNAPQGSFYQGVDERVICMVAKYRDSGMAAQFSE